MRSIGLNENLVESCDRLRIYNPTEIQRAVIPLILNKFDIVASAPTGEGKTLCYLLPILQELYMEPYGVFSLIILPTRELAEQVGEQVVAFLSGTSFDMCLVIGGGKISNQATGISNRRNIVVGTPGRLNEIIECNEDVKQAFKRLRYLVLDEVDKLMSESYENDLKNIIQALPSAVQGRNTLLFSATLTKQIRNLVNNIIDIRKKLNINRVFKIIDLNPFDLPPSKDVIQQYYIYLPSLVKNCYLYFLLKQWNFTEEEVSDDKAIVFTASCKRCNEVWKLLELLEIETCELNSTQRQWKRFSSLEKIRNSQVEVLVSTDLASRGLDIPNMTFVINYDFPRIYESYIHRIGRTGRAGTKGLCISFITEKDIPYVAAIEEKLGYKLKLYELDELEAVKYLDIVTKKTLKASYFFK